MKTFEHLIALAILIVFSCACTNKAKQSNVQNRMPDSAKVDSVSVGSVTNDTFTSPDLIMNELKSHVKTCETFCYDASFKNGEYKIENTKAVAYLLAFTKEGYISKDRDYDLTYDAQGKLIEGRYLPYKEMRIHIMRNKAGYIDTLACIHKTGEETDGGFRIEYKWNNKNELTEADCVGWEWGYNNQYVYNEKGLREKFINSSFPNYEEQIDNTYTYSYVKFDNKNNWIERNIQLVSITTITDMESGESTKSAPRKSYQIEKREITYY